jgi:hypothetical protein
MRRAIAHRLEGSRFGTYAATSKYSLQRVIRPKNVAAGGSRELPRARQLCGPGVRESKATSVCTTLGRSREPPVFTRFGRISVETKIAG